MREESKPVPHFNKEALCVPADGEINKAVNHLFKLCQKEELPLFIAVNYKCTPSKDGLGAEIMNTLSQVCPEAGAPPNYLALQAVINNYDLAQMVLNLSANQVAMDAIAKINKREAP